MSAIVLALSAALVAPVTLTAQSTREYVEDVDEDGNTVFRPTVTEVEFTGVDVEGELVKPQVKIVAERPGMSTTSLIRLREDFNDQMSESVAQVK
jgi:hypothetical protein